MEDTINETEAFDVEDQRQEPRTSICTDDENQNTVTTVESNFLQSLLISGELVVMVCDVKEYFDEVRDDEESVASMKIKINAWR